MSDRRTIETPSGRIAYVDRGDGPTALFVHGVFLNANLCGRSRDNPPAAPRRE